MFVQITESVFYIYISKAAKALYLALYGDPSEIRTPDTLIKSYHYIEPIYYHIDKIIYQYDYDNADLVFFVV